MRMIFSRALLTGPPKGPGQFHGPRAQTLQSLHTNVLVDHWIQEPWWKADLAAALSESTTTGTPPSAVHYIHVDCGLAELERREGSRGDRVLGTSRWSKEHGTALQHGSGSTYELRLDSGNQSTEEMVAAVVANMVSWGLLP